MVKRIAGCSLCLLYGRLAKFGFIYITPRIIFEPFSVHYPSQDHMDDLC